MDIVCAKGTKAFLHDYKVSVLPNSSMIRCEVNNMNISVKMISDKEVKVFGDYDIDISYLMNSRYASSSKKFFMTEKKSFLEIINLEEIEEYPIDTKNLELRYSFVSEPKCNIKTAAQNGFHVQVLGEILIELVMDDYKDSSESIKESPKQEVDAVNTSFYMKEDDHFINTKGSSQGKKQKPISNVKRNKSKFQKAETLEPIKSWLFQIKENLPVTEILNMDIDTLQNKQDTVEAVSVDDVADKKTFDEQPKQEEKEVDKKKITSHEVKIKSNLPKQLFI
ncbi:hypothetical protein FQB35_00260 [Crassaminicella thermophila]|uniref:Uncharacterized protein n=1 Tax=Crassaminicella thermophila TaxID=2599308 RepID=A0A5C0SBQ0_CRATE|nr:outer spore coat protein CotE [Crassaminicella thermophila]QEK10928.1 hypothetical protein FQB35_00260 [Crassaminicella thermophila]